jgi:phosphoglycerol transferase MdoB-like AlkP superfamily enzyme
MKSTQFFGLGFLTLALIFCFIAMMQGKMSDSVFSSIMFIQIPTVTAFLGFDHYNKRKVVEKEIENGSVQSRSI